MVENYLRKHNKTYHDIIETSDVNESQLINMQIILYPDEVLEQVGAKVNKDKSVVLYELLVSKNSEIVTKVQSRDDLLEAIKKRTPYIFIPESLRQEENRLVNSIMQDKDTLGFQLGSAGAGSIFSELLYRIQMSLSSESEEFKEIKSKLRRYHVRAQDKSGHLIYEKEQAY